MLEREFWFHPNAQAEALAAHDHYAEYSPAAGEAFQNEIERARNAILRNPETWASFCSAHSVI